LIFRQGIVYERTIFISFSLWYWIDSVPLKPGKNFESRGWGRRSRKLSDTVTQRKNLLPNSDLRAERDCTAAYAHAGSYGISYTIWWMILRALFCKDSSFWDWATIKPWCQTIRHSHILGRSYYRQIEIQ